jgi:hypothetical protein
MFMSSIQQSTGIQIEMEQPEDQNQKTIPEEISLGFHDDASQPENKLCLFC